MSDVCAGSESSGAWTEVEWPFRVLHEKPRGKREGGRSDAWSVLVVVGGACGKGEEQEHAGRGGRARERPAASRGYARCCPRRGPSIHVQPGHLRNLTAPLSNDAHTYDPSPRRVLNSASFVLLPSLFASLSLSLLNSLRVDALADSREVLARRGRAWRECDCRLTLRFGSSSRIAVSRLGGAWKGVDEDIGNEFLWLGKRRRGLKIEEKKLGLNVFMGELVWEIRDIRWNEECLAQRLGGVKDECLRRVLEIIAWAKGARVPKVLAGLSECLLEMFASSEGHGEREMVKGRMCTYEDTGGCGKSTESDEKNLIMQRFVIY